MTSAHSKRQKLASGSSSSGGGANNSNQAPESREDNEDSGVTANGGGASAGSGASATSTTSASVSVVKKSNNLIEANNFGVDVDDLTDDTDSDEDDDELGDDDTLNGDKLGIDQAGNHVDIQEQLAAAGPAGVAAAAAIATARKRKRPHTFETNPSVRKRQQTRLIRKLRACIDEYTMRVGQQAVVLITMPGKAVHNFKVFGAQPLESVIRTCKHEIMSELEQALLEQAPQQFKEDANKHELPPLVIDGIPTPVEKMTQAQLRAFIPLMLKYSTGRGKPGWGKDTTRPPWWPETLPWANVRSDAREESEKQRISWTTTLRQIVTNCYKYHGRDDLLPTFDENETGLLKQEQDATTSAVSAGLIGVGGRRLTSASSGSDGGGHVLVQSFNQQQQQQQQQQIHRTRQMSAKDNAVGLGGGIHISGGHQQLSLGTAGTTTTTIYSATPTYASNFVHTITNSDGTMSLIQMDPANSQIFTLPDGTQVRAVRLQTLGADSICGSQHLDELHEANTIEISAAEARQHLQQQQHHHQQQQQHQHQQQLAQNQAVAVSEASLGADGQIIVTGEDGVQSCYPMSSLVSIPASMYQQFAQGGQQLSIVTTDGTSIPANAAISIHAIQDPNELIQHQQDQQQQNLVESHHQVSDQQQQQVETLKAGEQMVATPEDAADKTQADPGQVEGAASAGASSSSTKMVVATNSNGTSDIKSEEAS